MDLACFQGFQRHFCLWLGCHSVALGVPQGYADAIVVDVCGTLFGAPRWCAPKPEVRSFLIATAKDNAL